MKICPNCKVEVADDANVCATCGYAFEEAFDHKPLVTEWAQNNGFAKFLFNWWPKINLIGNLVSVLAAVVGVLAGFLGLIANVLNLDGISGVLPLGLSLLSFALGLRAVLYGIDLVFNNRLKKILFASFLKKKGVDLDEAAKYVFGKLSVNSFSSINKRDKGSLSAWLDDPQHFGEAVMMAAKPETRTTNLIWMIVLAVVGFVCQSIIAGAITSALGGVFSLDFDAGLVGSALIALIVGAFFLIVATIADIIVSTIGMKKLSEVKATWAASVTAPAAAQNEEVVSA